MTAVHLTVMARQPQPGQAKTRLVPALGAEGAARLAARLLEHTLSEATRAAVGPVALAVTPDAPAPALEALAARHGVALAGQGAGDLGERMARQLASGLTHAPAALVIGTDAPGLDAARLQQAAAAIAQHDAVLWPALDGGFVLIGLRRCPPGLLSGLAWSHDQVLRDTQARLAAAGLAGAVLQPALADIDTPADLWHLPPGWLGPRDQA